MRLKPLQRISAILLISPLISMELYVAQIGNDQIDKVHPDGMEPCHNDPQSLRSGFWTDGNLYVCNSDRGRSSVFRVLPDGTVETFASEFAETLKDCC